LPALAKEPSLCCVCSDSDNDQLLDLARRKRPPMILHNFGKDGDETLDAKELKGHVYKKSLKKVIPRF
jgi:hypothetical protein